ncbi:uncharacterized protein LOC133184918 [Saccostrea echinata]|uniref:uncharacterized protein LOC133184918 n=1 Tax=Saccostrea echinata TaxID=191078 RepID=UPI002A838655|nr:uncharacterized protein LOC133184918 [Saccostrea echinata]
MHMKQFEYATKRCSLRFKTKGENCICAEFNDFHVEDCSVQLKFLQEKQPIDLRREPSDVYLFKKYICGDSLGTVCSTGPNLTIQLFKENINAQGYSFQVKVLSKHTDFAVKVGVISGVAVFIVILVTIILYHYCYKKRRCKCNKCQRVSTESEEISEQRSEEMRVLE